MIAIICLSILLSIILFLMYNWLGIILVLALPEILIYLKKKMKNFPPISNKVLILSVCISVGCAVWFKWTAGQYYYKKAMIEQQKGNIKQASQYYRNVLGMLPDRIMKKKIYFYLSDIKNSVIYMSNDNFSNNVVRNTGNFESIEDFLVWNILTRNMELNNDIAKNIEIDHQIFKSSNTSMRITIDYPYDKNYYVFNAVYPVKKDTLYIFSIFTKIEMESGYIHWAVEDKEDWRKWHVPSDAIKNNSGWKKVLVKFNSKDSAFVRIRLRHYGDDKSQIPLKGTIWIDDWEIKEL